MAPLYDPGRIPVSSRAPVRATPEEPDLFHPTSVGPRWNTEQLMQNLLACLTTMQDELEDIGVLLDLLRQVDPLGRERQARPPSTLEAAGQVYARFAPAIKQELIGSLVLVVQEHMARPVGSAPERLPVPV
jgi:hypothetical protein